MAFDPLNYTMSVPYAVTQPGDLELSWTTSDVIKKYTPGQMAWTWDPLYGYRIFKLVKNLNGSALTQGHLVSNVAAASIGTVTAGTTTSITSSSMTANDLEYQMIIVADDAGAAGAAPEGECSLCIGNTTTEVYLHPDYAFTAAVAASDSVYVNYVNGVEQSDTGDTRGVIGTDKNVQGVVYGSAPADNYWFWILQKGWARVMNLNGLTADTDMIQSATSGLIGDFSSGHETVIGQNPVAQFAGAEESYATVYINCLDVVFMTGSP